MAIDIERLKEVVQNPLTNSKYYHGDAQRDLLDILDNYTDADNLAVLLDDAEATIEGLNDELKDKAQDIRDLEKQVDELNEKLAECE